MLAVRWRVGAMFAVLAAAVVCFSLQPAGIVTAEDKSPQSSVKEEPTTDESTGDQETNAGEKPATSKTKKSDAKSKKKQTKKATKKDTAPRSSTQPPASGQRSGSNIGGGTFGGGNSGAAGAGAYGSSGNSTTAGGSGGSAPAEAAGLGGQAGGNQTPRVPDPKEVQRVIAVQEKHNDGLLKQEGVLGTATGLTKDGRVVLRVYSSGAAKPAIPAKLGGVETEVVLTGPIRPLSGFAGSPKYNPQKRIARPIAIGVSSLNEQSPACSGSICATGTIGCRLKAKDGSGYYALSNNHVFANENAASLGTTIVQPGPLDNNCECAPDDVIGQLSKFKTIKDIFTGLNVMDAAIMKTTDQLVGNSTLPDGYGAPRTFVWKEAFLGQKVMKYGRTTGFTLGVVTGVNVFVVVPYDFGLALFHRQVEIFGDGGLFSDAGDSGSLIVDRDRFPVALLFAGGGGFTIGNPIQDVLDEFGMEIDGDSSEDFPPPGKIGSARPK